MATGVTSSWLGGWFTTSSSDQQQPYRESVSQVAASANSQEEREAATQQLRCRLLSDEGQQAAEQLIQGGEIASPEQLVSDEFVQRWLRARRWDVDAAYTSIIQHAAWRAQITPQGHIFEDTIKNELYSGKAFLQGCDKAGRPLVVVQVRKHTPGWNRDMAELERFCVYMLDAAVKQCNTELNPRGRCIFLIDLSDMGLANMDISAMKSILTLLGTHYVERLGCMYYYNPPSIFWTAWNSMSSLIPEVTRNKIKFVNASERQELLENVDKHVLPIEYGGSAELVLLQDAVAAMRGGKQ